MTEAYLLSNDICGFRNILTEIGVRIAGPSVQYIDCAPARLLAEGKRNLTSASRWLDIRCWKLRERIDTQDVTLAEVSTMDCRADIGTKGLLNPQFRYLRDTSNGYALVRLMFPDRQLPPGIIESAELLATLKTNDEAGEQRREKKIEHAKEMQKTKRRRTSKRAQKRKSGAP